MGQPRNQGHKVERAFNKRNACQQQPASGAFAAFPEDGIKGCWMLQIKSTIKQSIGLSFAWLDQLYWNAVAHGKKPMLVVIFSDVETRAEPEWVMIPKSEFDALQAWGERKKK